jgi:NAD+ diphosphatase
MSRSRFLRQVDHGAVPQDNGRCFLFAGDQMLVLAGDPPRIPDMATLVALDLTPQNWALLGFHDGTPCFVGQLPTAELPPPLQAIGLRQAYGLLPEHDYGIAGYAAQIAYWERTTRFCPVCATATESLAAERAKRCPACGFTQYPRVSPAMIVLIHRPGQVLLTRQPQWPQGRYSLVAGFVEPGESLEACVRREVAEEVGVTLGEIRYLGSQPWPFPHQLMCGFIAPYQDGELAIDTSELEHAAWFDLDALPDLPPPLSIARRILDWHLAVQRDPAAQFPDDPASM